MSIDTGTTMQTDGIEILDEPPESEAPPSAVGTVSRWMTARLEPVWREPRLGLALAVVLGATWGLVVGQWTPRGPLTSAEALWSIVISLVVGGLATLLSRSRWAVLIAPLSFAIVVEIVRAGIDGPTIDRPAFSTYGVLALVVGRLFHALLSLAPMSFGAALGLGAARHLGGGERATGGRARVRRGVMILSAVGLVAFMLVLARPARTDTIRDANGNEVSGSIAELDTVEINGHDLALMVRGHSLDNPVLLYLAGGPGGSERCATT